ncbi:fibrous sheath CABYR-binding protein-like isoform X3 [Sardina pilchardus]|uniref:fibrous sheath CABYR-binding protein-like isoform X3 n=1 Tax=Sardina pilchardus TaxID=27697 RepID=UPI002E1604E7
MSLGLMFRLPWICLFFLTDVGLCSPQVQENLNSHQEKLIPVWTFGPAQEDQKSKTVEAPAQERPAWIHTASTWIEMPPAPVSQEVQEPKVPEAPAQEPPAWAQMRPTRIMPTAPVNQEPKVPEAPAQKLPVDQEPKVPEAPAQEPPAWAQMRPTWIMPPAQAPVNQEPKVPEAPAQEPPVWAQLRPAWIMPPAQAPVNQEPKVPEAPAQEPPAWAQMHPIGIMPPAPVNQEPKVPEAPAQKPPTLAQKLPQQNKPPVSQAPAQTPPSLMTPIDPVGGSFGSSFMEGVGGEATSNGGATEGPSSGRERYLVITEPLGFQTRYVVKSFNRYVRGKRIYSQTTYIPLDYPPASEPAPVPTLPPHEAQVDQTVKATPARKG